MESQIRINRERLGQVARIADAAVRPDGQPSVVVAVANRNETLWTYVAPGADGIRLDSIFLLASITKPIVATAIMRLVEEGKLLLHRPVVEYVPEFGKFGKEQVTAWHLLTHTSGLEEGHWYAELHGKPTTAQDYLDAACQSYLHFEPGTRTEYCSLTFSVLGELITRLGEQPYPDYLRQHIFTPLGMRDAAFRPRDRLRAAPVYDFGTPEELDHFGELAVPGGGLWSTASDLVAFGQTFLQGGRSNGYRLLGPAALAAMTRRQVEGTMEWRPGIRSPFHYALGWSKLGPSVSVIGSDESYGHGGATGTYFWVDPVWDLVFVFLTNRWGIEQETARRALNAVYGALERGG